MTVGEHSCVDLDDPVTRGVDGIYVHSLKPRFARAVFDSGAVIYVTEGLKETLADELTRGALPVEEARERVTAAAEKVREGT